MSAALPALVLFDFDDVLAAYSHQARIAHLARACSVADALVSDVLFESGLESEYDGGSIDTATYLARLGAGLGTTVDEAVWIAARMAGSRVDPTVTALVETVAARTRIGVLSNNGVLLAEVARRLLPGLFPGLEGRVLCSGALGVRKPDAGIFRQALAHFGAAAGETLFLDDKAENVDAARALGMKAECVPDPPALAAALRTYGLVA